MELAIACRSNRIVLELDCLGAVSKLQSRDIDRSAHGPLVEQIKSMMKVLGQVQVKHVRRVCNGVAHYLGKLGCGNKLVGNWVAVPPGCIVELLDAEFSFE
jgi:hypothetical protein